MYEMLCRWEKGEREWARHGVPLASGVAGKLERPCELHGWAGAPLSHRVASLGDRAAPGKSVNGEVGWAVGAPDEELVFEVDWGGER
jgi:hypothetical protein